MNTIWLGHHRPLVVCGIVILLIALFAVSEMLYIVFDGAPVPRPHISHKQVIIGSGPELTYAVLGDSTAAAQGADYTQGFAFASAEHVAATHTVRWANFAVPGARAYDVLHLQLPQATAMKPDLVLIAVGANDVTHFTSPKAVSSDLQRCIHALRTANPQAAIVLTGSPDMGSVPRFPQPIRWFAGVRTKELNQTLKALTQETHTTFAPIAAKTGPAFRKHPEYYAVDDFHPNAAGYDIWKPVINAAIDTAPAMRR